MVWFHKYTPLPMYQRGYDIQLYNHKNKVAIFDVLILNLSDGTEVISVHFYVFAVFESQVGMGWGKRKGIIIKVTPQKDVDKSW